jgi:hypothetical protein
VVTRFSNKLAAIDAGSGGPVWTATTDDESRAAPAIAIGHDIYTFGTAGQVQALGSEDGKLIWSEPAESDISSNRASWARTLAAAPGVLLAARAGRLTAWTSALRPGPREIAVVGTTDVLAGDTVSFGGILGKELRAPGRPIGIEVAARRSRRFRGTGSVPMARDGGFGAAIKLARNSRVRVTAGGATSAPVNVFVEPGVTLGQPRAASRTARRLSLRAVIRADASRLAGRRFVLYLFRSKAGRLDRVASSPLRRAGRGRMTATLRFRPLRRVGKGDKLTWCTRGQVGQGYGRPSDLNRRCGAARVRDR